MRARENNSKNVWWNDEIKAAIEGKVASGARDEAAKGTCIEVYKEKRKTKRYIYRSKKEVKGLFGRKMNQDVDENRKFWKEVNKVEIYSRIKDRNRSWH